MSTYKHVSISPELELYYVDEGTGVPIIFIPGWCATATVFDKYQIPHFSRNYRAISYDPRGHGHSSKTLEHNHYKQRGKDLNAFIEALDLKQVILVGHSAGCLDIYAYLREFGTGNLNSIVFVDYMPKPIAAEKGDWAEFSDAAELGPFVEAVVQDFPALLTSFASSLMSRELTKQELSSLMEMWLMTPTHVAALTLVDAAFSDFTAEARKIDGTLPVFNLVSDWYEGWAASAQAWLSKNTPNSEVQVLGKHLMFLEFPEEFNTAIDLFLKKSD